MDLLSWFRKRGPLFILQRGQSLLDNYGVTAGKAQRRIDQVMRSLELYQCSPTFFVPGIVAAQHQHYIHSLQDRGAEIGVHGYNHIDLNSCSASDAAHQLKHASDTFKTSGLEVFGFRAPYLSCSDALLEALDPDLFNYSSNRAFQWDLTHEKTNHARHDLFSRINHFYHPQTANTSRCLPFFQSGLVEIPVCVPDDLQIKDGLRYDQDGLADFWLDLLQKTYHSGEIFNLMFHPELATFCEKPFAILLEKARSFEPSVWITRLGEIAKWWRQKSKYEARITQDAPDKINIDLPDSPQPTWLVRNMNVNGIEKWNGGYDRLTATHIQVQALPRPFVGVDRDVPLTLIDKLSNQGYLLDTGETAKACSVFIDQSVLQNLSTEAQVADMIEGSNGPLIRMWPWPYGYRSALCVSGDLDALTLLDYGQRIFTE